MASIIARPNGTKYIQITINKRRSSVWLGEVSQRNAERFRDKIEDLAKARSLGLTLPQDVAAWVGKLSAELASRLAELDLIEPPAPKLVVSIGGFLDEYLSRRADDVKDGTLTFYGHTARNLKEFFGSDRLLNSITAGDADDFRRHLQKVEKLASATVVRRCALARTFLKDAVRRKLIDSNPFDGVGKGSTANPERQRFIDRATIAKVIDACPNAEWRLLVAVAGGVVSIRRSAGSVRTAVVAMAGHRPCGRSNAGSLTQDGTPSGQGNADGSHLPRVATVP